MAIQRTAPRRPPRVCITYTAHLDGAPQERELPFVIGVLGDFVGAPSKPLLKIKERRFVEVTADNFDAVLASLAPRLALSIEDKLAEDPNADRLFVELRFGSLKDFDPDHIASQVTGIARLLDLRKKLSDLWSSLEGNLKLRELLLKWTSGVSELDQNKLELGLIQLDASTKGTHASEQSHLNALIKEIRLSADKSVADLKAGIAVFVGQVAEGEIAISDDIESAVNLRIRKLDHLASIQVNEILHTPSFQKLEATWRSLKYLLDQTPASPLLKIKILQLSKKELLRDLELVPEVEESALFQRIVAEETGVSGPSPIQTIVGDYEFGHDAQDLMLLEKLADIAALVHSPFLSMAAPGMLNLDSFTNIGAIRDLNKVFESTEYAKWKAFRQSENSKYVGLCLPHVLMREPYGPDGGRTEAFNYVERIDNHTEYLWGNPVYALAARLTQAFATYGWCAAIRGVEGGGLVEALPTHRYQTDEGETALKCPTEVAITDRREKELADHGFIPLIHCKNTDYAAFFSVQSSHKPKLYDSAAANANARLASQLTYTLAISRFAHYVKAIILERAGSRMSAAECQHLLNEWISENVSPDEASGHEANARLPLRAATVQVNEIAGKPGQYVAIVFLRPHFQLEELTVSLRIIVKLPRVNPA